MKGQERRAARNREKIIQTAMVLFMSEGIKKVTVNDIALKAGFSPATVYNQFGSKDKLVVEALRLWADSVLDDFKKMLETGESFEMKLQDIMAFKTDMAGKIHGEFLMAMASNDPEVRKLFEEEYLGKLKQHIYNFYDEGREQGYIGHDLSTDTILRFTEIVRNGINAESKLSSDPYYTVNLLRDLTPIFLYGLVGKGKR